jgi:large subunit ribosomal protein L18e
MKSKTKIDEQLGRKKNPELIASILKAKKNEKWLEIAGLLSSPRRNKISINLDDIDKNSKEGDTIVVPGKILSSGEITKKIRVSALAYSKEAEKKLKAGKCELVSLVEELKKNPKMQGVKIIK